MKKTRTFDFEFIDSNKLNIPMFPSSHIYIKRYTEKKENKGLLYITPECVTYKEVEAQVKRLKNELDIIMLQAKKKYDEYIKRSKK